MVSLSANWNTAKKAMGKIGVDTAVFNQSFTSSLDDFEKARRKYDEIGGKDPQKLDDARSKLKAKKTKAKGIAGQYGNTIQYLYKHATDTKQKSVLDDAGTTMMGIINAINSTAV